MATIPEAALELLGADEEISEDLKLVGVEVVTDLDQTKRDTIASILMRRMAEQNAAIAQLEASKAFEVGIVESRYADQIKRAKSRVFDLELGVAAVACHTKDAGGYVGKKKSRDVGAGTYGYKTYAAGAELKDEATYLTWAEANAPETLRVKPTMSLAQAREYLTEKELEGIKREIMKTDVSKLIATDPQNPPPGYTLVPETNEYYAKPLPFAAIAPSPATASKAA